MDVSRETKQSSYGRIGPVMASCGRPQITPRAKPKSFTVTELCQEVESQYYQSLTRKQNDPPHKLRLKIMRERSEQNL
jgi:hypothetical protein